VPTHNREARMSPPSPPAAPQPYFSCAASDQRRSCPELGAKHFLDCRLMTGSLLPRTSIAVVVALTRHEYKPTRAGRSMQIACITSLHAPNQKRCCMRATCDDNALTNWLAYILASTRLNLE